MTKLWICGIAALILTGTSAMSLAGDLPDRGDRIQQRPDARGDRIEARKDARGNTIDRRLDRRQARRSR